MKWGNFVSELLRNNNNSNTFGAEILKWTKDFTYKIIQGYQLLIQKPMFPFITGSISPSCSTAKMYMITEVDIYGVRPICQTQFYALNMY